MYGPKGRTDMMPRRLLENIHAGIEIEKYGSGEGVRDWLYITDAVNGILAILRNRNPMGFEIFNLGTGIGTTVNELISIAETVVGRPAVIVNVDPPPGDAYFGGLCDITKAKRLLKWKPQVDLKTGLTRTFEYMLREQVGVSSNVAENRVKASSLLDNSGISGSDQNVATPTSSVVR